MQQVERFKTGWWGADMKRLQYVLEAVRKIRLDRIRVQDACVDGDGPALATTDLQDYDCLSLLLKPGGIIGH